MNQKLKNEQLKLRLPICKINQLFRSLVYFILYRSPMYETFRTESKIN